MENAMWVDNAEMILDYAIMGTLILMSIVALWLSVERLLFYSSIHLDSYDNKDQLELDLSDNLSTIATIGSNAPYIGLLGTVLGIMITFYTMGEVGTVDAAKIMSGLAMALKATAMGLIVAIPSIVFYNGLVRKMEKISTQWDIKQSKAK
ncbi:MAG: TonB-system energizer ExbB [Helicobacteraceae bacterium]|nr:TonB-system energizer ExbB [Helicobacteraceae bacterium]